MRFFHNRLTQKRLQWGHALSGMDTATASQLLNPENPSFNGAMPFQAWIPAFTIPARIGPERFNGAMPFQAWIRMCGQNGIVRSSLCFNGAMPFQAWIRRTAYS